MLSSFRQADELELRLPIGLQLLVPLAAQPGHERVLALVDRIEMAANADAGLPVEPRVAAGIGSAHEEDGSAVPNDDVRDELLVGRVGLGLGAVAVHAVAADGAPELGQVGGAGRADSVEVASARDQTALEYQDPFLHRGQSTNRYEARV